MKIIIIDGNHLACRAFFAIKDLKTSTGISTNATYGFINCIRSYARRWENALITVAWDGAGKKEAHNLLDEYKADRKPLPNDLYSQFSDIKRILSALSIPQFCLDHVEADDIIGTLTLKARKEGHKVIIVSSDHDFEQLITKHVQIMVPSLAAYKEIFKDYSFVDEKYNGLRPKQLIEMMSLAGDGSDNVSGVEGIGSKTAISLIKANENLQQILESPGDLKNINKKGEFVDASKKLKQKISDNIRMIKVFNKIVKIDCHVPINIKFKKGTVNLEKLKQIFKELEFKRFLKDIGEWQELF